MAFFVKHQMKFPKRKLSEAEKRARKVRRDWRANGKKLWCSCRSAYNHEYQIEWCERRGHKREPVCNCGSYHFPHRLGSGVCENGPTPASGMDPREAYPNLVRTRGSGSLG